MNTHPLPLQQLPWPILFHFYQHPLSLFLSYFEACSRYHIILTGKKNIPLCISPRQTLLLNIATILLLLLKMKFLIS